MSIDITSISHTGNTPTVRRTADGLMCSGLHRATIRREKRSQRGRGEGRGARQTSNRHPVGLGVVRSITSTSPVARAPPRAAVRASAGLRSAYPPPLLACPKPSGCSHHWYHFQQEPARGKHGECAKKGRRKKSTKSILIRHRSSGNNRKVIYKNITR